MKYLIMSAALVMAVPTWAQAQTPPPAQANPTPPVYFTNEELELLTNSLSARFASGANREFAQINLSLYKKLLTAADLRDLHLNKRDRDLALNNLETAAALRPRGE